MRQMDIKKNGMVAFFGRFMRATWQLLTIFAIKYR
jgi:hypothetical protein